jgi:hypothetical protein
MNALKFIPILCIACFTFTSCDDEKEAAQPQPTITALSITEGEVGTNVIITGTNFGTVAADIEVTFNNTEASIATFSATTIATTVPTGATSGIVKVKVKSLEANGPSFTVLAPITLSVAPFSVTINENPINGGLLGTINATTNRGNLSYSLTSQSVPGAMAINSTTGILTVASVAAFDFEVNPTITGVVSVVNGSETATANITITLNNVVDVAVNNFSTTVAENIANSSILGTMNVTTGSGTFAITSQTPIGALQINTTTGQLTVLNSSAFDFEVTPTISATVSLTGGSEVKTATVTINLTDVTEVNLSNFSLSITENPSLNAVIGTAASFASIPNGVGGSIQYSIISQTPSGAMAINASTGQLTVANTSAFDFETNPVITANIAASNQSETKNATATISVTDVSEGQTNVAVNLVAGSETLVGCSTGSGSSVLFNSLFFGELTANESGVYVTLADFNCGIRRVLIPNSGSASSTSISTNVAGSILLDVVYGASYSLATYYNSVTGAGNILKIPTNGSPTSNLLATNAVFMPTGITTDAAGNIYVAETDGRKIKVFSSIGTFLGSYGTGAVGGADGPVNTATFARTRDVQIDANGNLYVADRSSVRKIDTNGNVTTVAGANNLTGDAIGSATAARFNEIYAIGLLPNGGIVVADHGNGKIKLIDVNGNVTTLTAGDYVPSGIMIQDNNNFFFTSNSAIYKVTLSTGCVGCR